MRQKVLYAGFCIGAAIVLIAQLVGYVLILARFVGN
jgi:hypothetical protein